MTTACEVCGRGPSDPDGTAVFRQNPVGQPGIWRCREHNQVQVDDKVNDLVAAIQSREQPA